MTCKRPHNDPQWIEDGGLPEFLCRECHPEYDQTPESNAKFYADLRARNAAQAKRDARDREIRKARLRIEGLEREARNEIITLEEKIEDLNRDPDAKEATITELQEKLDKLREYRRACATRSIARRYASSTGLKPRRPRTPMRSPHE